MDLEEYAGKSLIREQGLPLLPGKHCLTSAEVRQAVAEFGPCVIKAQVASGKRGKAGGIKFARNADEASAAADAILSMTINGQRVRSVLVEPRASIAQELYAAIVSDAGTKGPLVIVSSEGGMDIEEIAARDPAKVRRAPVNIIDGFDLSAARQLVDGLTIAGQGDAVPQFLVALYGAWRTLDAELLEINPLAVRSDGSLVVLDCKLSIDDASLYRQPHAAKLSPAKELNDRQAKARDASLNYIELDGDVGVLANGAGLTMTTMDLVAHFGGRPANFLEIGGEAYTKAKVALELVLSKPGVKSLVVNFCGAFARTDVMADGVVTAWQELSPDIPVFFSIHGTGDEAARELVAKRLGFESYEYPEDAVRAAVEAAR